MKVARVNDLTKEAMVQSIKEGDLRFLTVNIFLLAPSGALIAIPTY